MRFAPTRLLFAAALTTLALTACGDGDGGGGGDQGGPPPGDPGGLQVGTADPLQFDRGSYTASAGEIPVTLTNTGSSVAHSFVVEGHEGDLRLAVSGRGDSDSGTIRLEAGDYTVYCDVGSHRSGGMEATLTVTPQE